MAVPIIKTALTPDNSDVSLIYLNRPDVTVPIIASNKGSRSGVMASKAALQLFLTGQGDASRHVLFLTPTDSSRENLLIPENTSKQFFFLIDFEQPIPDAFSKLAAELKELRSLQRCVFTVRHLDFRGKEHVTNLVLFDASDQRWLRNAKGDSEFEQMLAATECIGKVPQPVRQRYNLLGG